MSQPSVLELNFEALFELLALPDTPRPVREFPFADGRRWRFDFAWPEQHVAVEIEGGLYGTSRHATLKGYTADCQKYNHAATLSWVVLRYTAPMLDDPVAVVAEVERVLKR